MVLVITVRTENMISCNIAEGLLYNMYENKVLGFGREAWESVNCWQIMINGLLYNV